MPDSRPLATCGRRGDIGGLRKGPHRCIESIVAEAGSIFCAVEDKTFARATVATVVWTVVPRHVLSGPRFVSTSEEVPVALVGAGGQGRANARALFQEPDAQVVAVADPIKQFSLEAFYDRGQGSRRPVQEEIEQHYAEKTSGFGCAEYEDFRVMFDKEKPIDVGTNRMSSRDTQSRVSAKSLADCANSCNVRANLGVNSCDGRQLRYRKGI